MRVIGQRAGVVPILYGSASLVFTFVCTLPGDLAPARRVRLLVCTRRAPCMSSGKRCGPGQLCHWPSCPGPDSPLQRGESGHACPDCHRLALVNLSSSRNPQAIIGRSSIHHWTVRKPSLVSLKSVIRQFTTCHWSVSNMSLDNPQAVIYQSFS